MDYVSYELIGKQTHAYGFIHKLLSLMVIILGAPREKSSCLLCWTNIIGESLSYYVELSTAVMITFILLLNLESKIEGLQDV